MTSPTDNSLYAAWVSSSLLSPSPAASLIYGQMWSGFSFTGSYLTWSIPSGRAWFDPAYSSNDEWDEWYQLTSTEIAGVTRAMQAWMDVTDLTARRVSDTASIVGEIRFARTASVDAGFYAHAYLPSNAPSGGDVWLSLAWNPSGIEANTPGSYDYLTLLHEIGHALGLKHSFAESPDNWTTMAQRYDSYFYTVMSYSAKPFAPDVTADFYPTTPMYYDLVAIQYLYDREEQVNAGNNTYKFVAGHKYWQTIDDAGGRDIIVYYGSLNCTIDLRQGKFSTLSAPINFSDGTSTRSTVCIGPNTVIENATGGSGHDKLIGNSAGNILKGGAGNDTLYGSSGIDYLSGGPGNDLLTGGSAKDIFIFNAPLGAGNVDRITDFTVTSDIIRLDDAIFTKLNRGGLSETAFVIGTRAREADDRIIYNNKTGDLFYDPDGTGAAAPIRFAVLSKNLTMTALDFEIT